MQCKDAVEQVPSCYRKEISPNPLIIEAQAVAELARSKLLLQVAQPRIRL